MPDPSAALSLSRIFRESAGPGTDPADDADLEHTLRLLVAEGASAWPEIHLPPDLLVRRLAAHGAGALAGVRVADLHLACACAIHGKGALEAFERVHLSQVGAYLARLRPAPAFVDEVRQMLREKLFVGRGGAAPKIAEYDGRGALASWVRVVALRTAIDLQRLGNVAPSDAREQEDAGPDDPELDYLKDRYRQAFNEAIRGAIEDLGPEPRRLLSLHFVQGLTLDQLAEKLRVHRATIARRIAKGRETIAAGARQRLRDALGVSEDELQSLVGVLRSQLDLSLSRLLPKEA